MLFTRKKKADKAEPSAKPTDKKQSKKAKRAKKAAEEFRGEPGFTYPYGYYETDPYLFPGKHPMAIFDVTFAYGTNSPADVGWLVRLIPHDLISNGTIRFIQRQRGVDKPTRQTIISKNLVSNTATIGSKSSFSTDAAENSKNVGRVNDLMMSSGLAKNDTVVDSDIVLIVKADTTEGIESAITELRENYKKAGIRGVMIVRRTGEQRKSLEELLVSVHGDAYHNSDMTTVAAGRLFSPSAGFSDRLGTAVGTDKRSLISNNPAIISFTNIRNAVIYMGDVKPNVSINGYEGANLMQNGGTAVAHVLADGNYLSGGRTHHIVISKNDFHTSDSLVFDMSKEAINPFEVFGKAETVKEDANAAFDKITTMLLMAAGLEKNDFARVTLKSALIDWYIYRAGGNGLYDKNPDLNPLSAQRILSDDNHEKYPLPTDFLITLNSLVSEAAKSSEDDLREAKRLYESLKTLGSSYPSIFKSPTTLPNVFTSSDRNIYYDLSALGEDQNIIGVQFLNVLSYVTARALKGEMIVIHGLDNIALPVEALSRYRKRMDAKGIGLISVFEHTNNPVNPVSYENFVGRLSQQDMIVLGGITEKDEAAFNKSWQQQLPATVAAALKQATNGVLYFYRRYDRIGALVDTHLIL